MKSVLYISCLCLLIPVFGKAQFAPQAGLAGSDAIIGTSSVFVAWATGCSVQRGYMNIADASLGFVTTGDTTQAMGAADGGIISLGDSGIAVLTFQHPIYDGPGPDFAVFENGFRNPADSTMAFLELGFVEVSSDGVNYFRFPANSLTSDTMQIPMAGVYMDASKINNLAGKYVGGYGTPFDLSELAGISGLDINHITHVRIIDVIGAISGHVSRDSAGRAVNDPYPTPIPTGGFDLDAVGVIHQIGEGVTDLQQQQVFTVYPNPINNVVNIDAGQTTYIDCTAFLTDVTGKNLLEIKLASANSQIHIANFPAGVYLLTVTNETGEKWVERIVKY